jgi:hypothetical protein
MARCLPRVAPRLERAAVVGDDVVLVVDGLRLPELDERQLAGRTALALRPRLARELLPHLVLKVRQSLREDIYNELVLNGDSLPDALVNIVEREPRRVELARAGLGLRLRLEATPALERVLSFRRDPELGVYALLAIEHCHLVRLALRSAVLTICKTAIVVAASVVMRARSRTFSRARYRFCFKAL